MVFFTCDRCDYQVSGYTRTELEKQEGWVWRSWKGSNRSLVFCGDCMNRLEPIWAEKKKTAAAA